MAGEREIVYTLKVRPDPGAASILKDWGRALAGAGAGGGGRMGGGAVGSSAGTPIMAGGRSGGSAGGGAGNVMDELRKGTDALVESARKGKGPLADMFKTMADSATDAAHKMRAANDTSLDAQMKKLNEAHNFRIAQEEKSAAATTKSLDKQVRDHDRGEKQKTRAAEREARSRRAQYDREAAEF
ncbi:MAG: hypothetical protein E8D43_00005, partial [Nitrospira sp.]